MRPEKQLLIDEMKNHFILYDGSFLIMSYASLKANTANQFRRDIAKLGGNVEIMSKRVLVKAAQAAEIPIDVSLLPGHVGLVFTGKDPIETTKAVFKYSQDTENAIKVIGGHFEGQLYSATDVEKLSKLPGKNEMRAQLLSTFEAPMSQTLAVIEAILSSIVYCLDNKCKQQGEG